MAYKIQIVKSEMDIHDYRVSIENRGFKKAGRGVFGTAHIHPGNRRVYKVGSLVVDSFDDRGNWAYLDFIKKVVRTKSNPWFPKIYSIKIYKPTAKMCSNKSFFVVSMEKLYKIKGTNNKSAMIESLVEFYDVFGNIFKKTMPNKNIKHFVKAMNILNKLEYSGHDLDIHNGNIMTRKDGQVVITDPVC